MCESQTPSLIFWAPHDCVRPPGEPRLSLVLCSSSSLCSEPAPSANWPLSQHCFHTFSAHSAHWAPIPPLRLNSTLESDSSPQPTCSMSRTALLPFCRVSLLCCLSQNLDSATYLPVSQCPCLSNEDDDSPCKIRLLWG